MRMKKKERESQDLLFALIYGGRRSDRELGRVLGVSQPTVTRKRGNLEREGLIREYTIIPDLLKMGYDFIAITFLSFSESRPELFEQAREWTKKQTCVIFAANGEGLLKDSCMVSVHKDYGSYSKLMTHLRRDWQPNLKEAESFIISLARPDLLVKPFSFRYLEANK
jgi:DNA-binding Lrp family transcriptional regulator